MIKKEKGFVINETLDRATILSMVLISVLISLLSLSIPVAAQTLINFIAFGGLLQPVITLSIVVFVIMIALGALHLWQMIIVEVIKQKLMVKISLDLTSEFSHVSLEHFATHHGPELVNCFFEIVSVKKNIASLLLYGVNLGLQVFFGLLLLLFYHPLFLVFDGFIILGLFLIIFIPYRKGLETAEEECFHKHQIGAWLEELLINRFLFRLNLYHRYATQQTDKRLVSFLKARNRHFKQLLKHQIGFYSLSALAGSFLLGIGGYLVINNQLSLGQLVAAEIVLGALIYAFKQFGVLFENYYDLKASQNKLEKVLTLPIDEVVDDIEILFVPIRLIQFKISGQTEVVASHESPLLIYSHLAEACQALIDDMLGFKQHNEISLFVNHTLCSYENRMLLRRYTLVIRRSEWFAGTIYDNLLLHQPQVSQEVILEELKKANLLDKIMRQPKGLKTVIYEWQTVFTELDLIKFMVARAILVKPQCVIIDRAFDSLDDTRDELMSQLLTLPNTILLVVTQDPDFKTIPNRLVLSS
jgi:ABC-type bacteriocin/lantibiotic exporter with double-glycine peptidase domain